MGYDEPLYYCLVQVGQPSVTIYAFQARVDAVVHTGEAILASGDKGVSAFHVDTCVKIKFTARSRVDLHAIDATPAR